MLAIVRIKIRLKETTSRGVVSLQTANMDRVWRRIVRNHKKWNDTGAEIVYLTHRSLQEDISVILDAKNMDSVANFIAEHLAPMEEVAAVRIMGLMRPRFFPMPKGSSPELKRFTIAISVEPNELDSVYDYLSNFQATKALVPVYLACTFNGFGRDFLLSILCPGETTAKKFVNTYVDTFKGIKDTTTTYLSQSKRLASKEDWGKLIKRFKYDKGNFEIDEMDTFEEDWIGGC
jgi:DNA-binding Lrp family transcriptional regulator